MIVSRKGAKAQRIVAKIFAPLREAFLCTKVVRVMIVRQMTAEYHIANHAKIHRRTERT